MKVKIFVIGGLLLTAALHAGLFLYSANEGPKPADGRCGCVSTCPCGDPCPCKSIARPCHGNCTCVVADGCDCCKEAGE